MKKEGFIEVYVDDIRIFTETFQQHLKHIRRVLEALRKAELTISPAKRKWAKTEVKYLGHILTAKGIMMEPDKLKAIIEMPAPKSRTVIQQFIKIIYYYRRFIRNCAKVLYLISKLLKNNQPWQWNCEQETVFNEIKRVCTTSPVLARPQFDKPFLIQTDFSNIRLRTPLEHWMRENNICTNRRGGPGGRLVN